VIVFGSIAILASQVNAVDTPEVPPAAPSLPQVGAPPPAATLPAATAPVVTAPAAAEPSPIVHPSAATTPAPAAHAATSPTTAAAPLGPALPTTTAPSATGQLGSVLVTADLDEARDQIAPSLGAVTYSIGQSQIQNTPGGEDASFQQLLLRAPGVVEDSYGQEHVRGEHGNLTYRINGVLLPEGLNGFGQELDTRVINTVTLIDGTLPAQFGFHTAGIVDVTTKTGASLKGGEISAYGGGEQTFDSSISDGGVDGKLDYFVTTSYHHNEIGIENPTPSFRAIHDETNQERVFTYLSYHISDTKRLTIMLNGSYQDFQIPDTPGLPPAFSLASHPGSADSADVSEHQNEQDYYGVISYQEAIGNFSYQVSVFDRYGQIHFMPDYTNDLIFQGVSGNVFNSFLTNGTQFDSAYYLNEQHVIRVGMEATYTSEVLNTDTEVFAVTSSGAQGSNVPDDITDDSANEAWAYGIYVQDEYHVFPDVTLNYGARYDRFDANFDSEGQLSPRVNLVWQIDDKTTAHAGYSRYFVPPPVQNVTLATLNKFTGTTNAPASYGDSAPRAERSNYYDIGISHQITKPWTVNLDGFYKQAHQLLDLGQFGDAVILSPYNYKEGTVEGAEISSTYRQGPISLFGNFSWVLTNAHGIDTQQFEFDPDELAYISAHNVHLDHESEYTISAGASYNLTRNDMVYVDFLFGSGLRAGFANLDKEPVYYPVNVGYQHIFHLANSSQVKFRFDVINIFDETYQLRDGSGLGVEAPQYGQRLTFLAGVSYAF
jgi:outer membrane receptor protein involved in Fe transport